MVRRTCAVWIADDAMPYQVTSADEGLGCLLSFTYFFPGWFRLRKKRVFSRSQLITYLIGPKGTFKADQLSYLCRIERFLHHRQISSVLRSQSSKLIFSQRLFAPSLQSTSFPSQKSLQVPIPSTSPIMRFALLLLLSISLVASIPLRARDEDFFGNSFGGLINDNGQLNPSPSEGSVIQPVLDPSNPYYDELLQFDPNGNLLSNPPAFPSGPPPYDTTDQGSGIIVPLGPEYNEVPSYDVDF